MSARNGDKARFNRVRKKNIARRKRSRALFNQAATQPKSADTSARTKAPSVSA